MRAAARATVVLGLVLIGCTSRPSPEVRRECDTAKRWLDLAEPDVSRCLREEAFRDGLRSRVDDRLAAQLTRTHNSGRTVLKLRGVEPSTFTRIAALSNLPVTGLGLEDKIKHVGERYVVRARVEWSSPVEARDRPGVVLHGDAAAKGHDSFALIGGEALNGYQHEFLSSHCLARYPTMCEGDMYVEILRDPRGFFVVAQLVGADLGPANEAAVRADMGTLRPKGKRL